MLFVFRCYINTLIYMVGYEVFFWGVGGEWVSVIIRRQFHTERTPLNDTDGGVMAGSADGYRRIPKRLRVLYCFQFASVSVHSEHILS